MVRPWTRHDRRRAGAEDIWKVVGERERERQRENAKDMDRCSE